MADQASHHAPCAICGEPTFEAGKVVLHVRESSTYYDHDAEVASVR